VVTNPLGTVTTAPVTLTVNVRDFSGAYFGRFNGTAGEFAVHVRADRTGVFLAHLPALQTGIAVLNLRLDLAGNFSVNTTTLASVVEQSAVESRSETAAAPQPVSLRGRIDDDAGTVSGTVTGLNVVFEGSRAARTGPAAAFAGLYQPRSLAPRPIAATSSSARMAGVCPQREWRQSRQRPWHRRCRRSPPSRRFRRRRSTSPGMVRQRHRPQPGRCDGRDIRRRHPRRHGTRRQSFGTRRDVPAAQLITGFVVWCETGLVRAAGPALASPVQRRQHRRRSDAPALSRKHGD
jgi:hypothetical protein